MHANGDGEKCLPLDHPGALGDGHLLLADGVLKRELHSAQGERFQAIVAQGHGQLHGLAEGQLLAGGLHGAGEREPCGAAVVGEGRPLHKVAHGQAKEALQPGHIRPPPALLVAHEQLQVQMGRTRAGAPRVSEQLARPHWPLAGLLVAQVSQADKPIPLHNNLEKVTQVACRGALIAQEARHAAGRRMEGGTLTHGKVKGHAHGFAVGPVIGGGPGDFVRLATSPGEEKAAGQGVIRLRAGSQGRRAQDPYQEAHQ